MNFTLLLFILGQVLLFSNARQIQPILRLTSQGELYCTKVDPNYECFNGMCPEKDRTCVKNGSSDTCCLTVNLGEREDPSPVVTDVPIEPIETIGPVVSDTQSTPGKAIDSTVQPLPKVGSFCACDVDESGLAKDWAEQMWMDIVIILDTSAAMGQSGVTETTSIIESFISRMNLNDLSTPKYSRIGLITASAWPKIQYYFNMSSNSDLSYIQADDILQFNFDEAFKAAQYLFNFWTPDDLHRSQVPRVIYLITNTRPPTKVIAADQFKQDGGTIIVTDFVQEGAVAQPLLQNIASPGYLFNDLTLDYTRNLVVFCGLNCFCPSSTKTSSRIAGSKPSLGCYQPMAEPASFNQANKNCQKENMELATIRNAEEEDYFVRVKGLPHWFGLRHDNALGFSWSDGENHSYENWAVQEPELENNQNCAYALKGTSKKIEWFTGNCNLPFYYSCSSAPCSAEKYCSEDELYGVRKINSLV